MEIVVKYFYMLEFGQKRIIKFANEFLEVAKKNHFSAITKQNKKEDSTELLIENIQFIV